MVSEFLTAELGALVSRPQSVAHLNHEAKLAPLLDGASSTDSDDDDLDVDSIFIKRMRDLEASRDTEVEREQVGISVGNPVN
jgi:hypothetical protein